MSIALLTNKTFLMRKTAEGTWENFIDITKYPQILGEAEMIEISRLHDTMKRYMAGLIEARVLSFEANYTTENYSKASNSSFTDSLNTYRLCFGDELGTDGCWEWDGRVCPFVIDGEVNGIRKMGFIITDEGYLPIREVSNPASPENENISVLGIATLGQMVLGCA